MKKLAILSFVCLLLIIALMLTTLQSSHTATQTTQAKQVILLTDVEKGAFYIQAEQGIEDAAAYANADLTVDLLDFNHLLPQAQAIADHSYEAILLYMENSEMVPNVLAILETAKIPVITVNSPAGKWCVINDTQTDASTLINAAKELGCTSFYISGTENNSVYISLLNNEDILAHIVSDISAASLPEGSCLITMDKDTTREVLDLRKKGIFSASIPLFCSDTDETRVADLESGYVTGMLLSRPYAIGYRSMQLALTLNSFKQTGQTIKVPSILVNEKTMYSLEIANTVFPLLQY